MEGRNGVGRVHARAPLMACRVGSRAARRRSPLPSTSFFAPHPSWAFTSSILLQGTGLRTAISLPTSCTSSVHSDSLHASKKDRIFDVSGRKRAIAILEPGKTPSLVFPLLVAASCGAITGQIRSWNMCKHRWPNLLPERQALSCGHCPSINKDTYHLSLITMVKICVTSIFCRAIPSAGDPVCPGCMR